MKLKEKNINIKIDIENNLLSKNIELKKKQPHKPNFSDKPILSSGRSVGANQPIHQVHNYEYNHSLPPEINAYYMIHAQKRLDAFSTPVNNADFFARQQRQYNAEMFSSPAGLNNIPDIPNSAKPPNVFNSAMPPNKPDPNIPDISDISDTPDTPAPFENSIEANRRRRNPEVLFNQGEDYIGANQDREFVKKRIQQLERYKKYINGMRGKNYPKPNKTSIIQYGLQQYFPDMFPDYTPPY